jgi:redox-sensitive bicupin YhaK (pirin superfamily)
MSMPMAALIEQTILPSVRNLGGGFKVRRALPSPQRMMVGPFIFFDSFGPVVYKPGEGLDARPHPHIGLSTLSYLLDGQMIHRDSEGYVQAIRPGEINLMTAGSGIVHSERSSDDDREAGSRIHGFQSWIALPAHLEETSPTFQHVASKDIPHIEGEGVSLRLLAGSLHGLHSPTHTFSDLFNAEVLMSTGARLRVDVEHIERAIYVVSGFIEVEGQGGFGPHRLIVFKPGAEVVVRAIGKVRLMLLGGEPLSEKRHVYWNFVSSRSDRLIQAAEDWKKGRFTSVPGDSEFIPLPAESVSPKKI